jgi:hypothetical protein
MLLINLNIGFEAKLYVKQPLKMIVIINKNEGYHLKRLINKRH